MERLGAEVQDGDADDQRHHGCLAGGDQPQLASRITIDAMRRLRTVAAVGEPAGPRRRRAPATPASPNSPITALPYPYGGAGEQERRAIVQSALKHPKSSAPEQHPLAQDRLLADQHQDRAQDAAVASSSSAVRVGAARPSTAGQHQHRRRSEHEYDRHPNAPAINPLAGAGEQDPISSPLITMPTTLPRSCSAASDELIGTITCATQDVTPTIASAAPKTT